MKKTLLLPILILLLLAACNEGEESTPTAFPTSGGSNLPPQTVAPQPVPIAELTAAPEEFIDRFLEINGQYQKRPPLICDVDRQSSPATWLLIDTSGVQIAVGGYDRELRSLIPNGLTLTVQGLWREWSGPVGCGKEAVIQQIFYLDVVEIVAPQPLSGATLTPGGTIVAQLDPADAPTGTATTGGEAVGTGGSGEAGTAVFTPTPAENIPSPGEPNTPTPSPPATDPGSGNGDDDGSDDSNPTRTPTLAPGPTATSGGGATPNPSNTPPPSATPGDSGSPTATNTPRPTATSSGGGNPTPTSPPVFATATVDPSQFSAVILDSVVFGFPIIELIGENESNLHELEVSATEPVTVTAVSEPDSDVGLRILTSSLAVVAQTNAGGNGEVEELNGIILEENETYFVQIYALDGSSTNYCLNVADEIDWFPGDVIAGSISYGDSVSAETFEGGFDYWCFMGETGDEISIVNEPDEPNADNLYIGLHTPDFDPFGDEFFEGLTLSNITLEETGMFMIGVFDFDDGNENGYTLTLTEN